MRNHWISGLFVAAVFALFGAPAAAQPQQAQPTPVFERIEPTSGAPGIEVQVIGRQFHPLGRMYLGNTALDTVRQLPNRWTVRIPAGATTGRIIFKMPWGVREIVTEGPEFRVVAAAQAPIIENFAPTTGSPGAEVTINGRNFSARLSENVVALNGRPAVVRSATPFSLIVVVPDGASTGNFTVRVGSAGEARSTGTFTVMAPTAISDFQPRMGPPGTRVTITGTGFAPNVRANRVYMNNVPVRVETATSTQLVVSIPRNGSTGKLLVDVREGGRAETPDVFTIQFPPTCSSIEPIAGPPGTVITLRGANFGTDIRVVQARLDRAGSSTALTVRSVAPTTLVLEVPTTASLAGETYTINVTVSGLPIAGAAQSFRVLPALSIIDFQPRSGPIGQIVNITGNGFSATPTENTVLIAGARAEVQAASPTQLRVRIPSTQSGPLEVSVLYNGTARSTHPFVVTVPPSVSSFEPLRGSAGSSVTLRGTNFGTNLSLVEVKIGDRACQVTSLTNEQIVAVLPANALTGRLSVSIRMQGTAVTARDFEVVPAFSVSSFSPAAGYPGTRVTLRGEGFAPQGMTVRFPGSATFVAATFVNATEIRAVVPPNAQMHASGTVEVKHPDGRTAQSTATFSITAPPTGVGVTAVEATCTRPGCVVVFVGYGFSSRANFNRVYFGDAPVRVVRATPAELTINLPATPGTQPFRIDVRDVGQTSTQPFTITAQ